MFGEMGVMLGQPRSATVLCSTPPLRGSGSEKDGRARGLCVVNEIKGEDFVRMLKQSESFLKSMKVILRTRLFRQGISSLSMRNIIVVGFTHFAIRSFASNIDLHRFASPPPVRDSAAHSQPRLMRGWSCMYAPRFIL